MGICPFRLITKNYLGEKRLRFKSILDEVIILVNRSSEFEFIIFGGVAASDVDPCGRM